MSESMQSSLRADTLDVEDLVARVRAGDVRVPAFQRGLRWTHKDVQRLFESISRGYPIGNLLLWQRPAEAGRLEIGALTIDAPRNDRAWFVVDGQQRLTSLANALTREGLEDPRFQLSYDLERQVFVRYAAGGSAHQVPLPVLFDLSELLRWFTDKPELQAEPRLIERANSVAKAIRQFRVPIYVVEQSDEAVLRDIFDRMNNYGKQLTRAEVFSALNEGGSGERQSGAVGSYESVAEQLHALTGFGLVDDNTVFLAFLARRGPDVTREIRSEFEPQGDRRVIDPQLADESPADAFDGTLAALERAVTFLQEEAGVPHFAFLPYRFILVVLARYFAHHPTPSPSVLRDLRRWTWSAAVGGPGQFKGSATGATRALASRVNPADEVGSVHDLLDALGSRAVAPFTLPVFKTNHAATRVALCAMWDLGPARLEPVGRYVRQDRDDLTASLEGSSTAADVCVRVASLEFLHEGSRTSAGNRLLLASQGADSDLAVAEWLAGSARLALGGDPDAQKVLESHLIDAAAAQALLDGQIQRFVELRSRMIDAEVTRFLTARAEPGFESTPPIDALVIPDEEDTERDDAVGTGQDAR